MIELIFNLVEGGRHVRFFLFFFCSVCLDLRPLIQLMEGWRLTVDLTVAARYQVAPDPTDGLPRQGHADLLQGAMEAAA